MSEFYKRVPATHIDGSPVYITEADVQAERAVAEILEKRWNCELRSFGKLAAIDWYAVRDERLEAVLELKIRSFAHDHHPTVFLNLRKWLALRLTSIGFGVPAIFVVQFTDDLYWVPLSKVGDDLDIGGQNRQTKSVRDIEPVIHVPIEVMSRVPSHD